MSKNRLARIIFSFRILKDGIKASNMEDLFAELPAETELINFSEDLCRAVKQITVYHPNFKELSVGQEIPEIIAKFTRDEDGIEDCELDFTEVLEDGYIAEFDGIHTKIIKESEGDYTFQLPEGFTLPCNGDVQFLSVDEHITVYDNETKPRNFTVPESKYYNIISTPRAGKSWMQEYFKERQKVEEMSGVSSIQRGNPEKSLKSGIATQMGQYWDPWYGGYVSDEEEKEEKEEKCKHEWKKVQGINRWYVICKHCEERSKEEEEKVNAK